MKKYLLISFAYLLIVALVLSVSTSCACPAATPAAEPAVPPAVEPAAPPAAEPAAPPAAGKLSFTPATYTNKDYGFSLQYPEDWLPAPDVFCKSTVAAFAAPSFVPTGVSLIVQDADKPVSADWLIAAYQNDGNKNVKVVSGPTATTLADGTKATEYKITFTAKSGYNATAFGLAADKDGKRITVKLWTVEASAPYNEAKFSEIAKTLTFTK